MNCVTIDDEPLARECICNYIREIDFLKLVGEGKNPIALTRMLNEHQVDLIFLDIQMPVINGIDFLKTSSSLPLVIITTAFPSYALESFGLDVIDYLLKPITFNRFFKAVNKAKEYHQLRLNFPTPSSRLEIDPTIDSFFIKCDSKYERIYFKDIFYIQAMQNYVTIYTQKGKYVTLLYLKDMEQKLDSRHFIRVHKSFIVSIPMIEAIENNEIVMKSSRIPISRNYRDHVINKVVDNKLWKKKK